VAPVLHPRQSHPAGGEEQADVSSDLEVLGRFLTTVRHNLIFYYLSLIEGAQARAFDSRDVDEYVLAPGLRLDKPIALGRIEPLHSALVMVMTQGIGANLTNDEKRAHLIDIRREHLIDQVCPQRNSSI
jgi:hypothetical protein